MDEYLRMKTQFADLERAQTRRVVPVLAREKLLALEQLELLGLESPLELVFLQLALELPLVA